MYDTGNPNLKCYGNLEGWDGEERGGRLRGKGTYMYLWLIHVDIWQTITILYAYLTYMQSTSWETLGWIKHNLESRLLGEISITSDIQITPPLWQKGKKTKEPLDESERGEWKVGLKFNIQKTKIMASGPITSWQIDGETGETVSDFILGGSKITADGDCSHDIKEDAYSLEEKLWPT